MAKPFDFRSELDALLWRQRYRRRRILSSTQGVQAQVDGKSVRVFCSNDYLGLASHPQVIKAFQSAAERYGVGSGASHLVVGHHALHHQLEEVLAERVGMPRALLFSSGYAANLGVITALLGRQDVLLQDKLNHASLLDGGRLCGATFHRYGHLGLEGLQRRLDAVGEQQHCLVATDAVFSMDGDVAPLSEISALCASRNAWLMVDDAHGFGVLGDGRGTPQALGCAEGVPVYMATLGKAIGVGGAFVAGDDSLIEYLIQRARTYIYTTALPPAMAAACLASLRLLDVEAWRRDHLNGLIERFRRGAQHLGLRVGDSPTAIQPLLLGEDAVALEASEMLWEQGFLVSAIRPPTVPEGSARLRITLSADHSEEDVDDLLCTLATLPLGGGLQGDARR